MPTDSIQLQIVKNGGAPATGVVTAALADTIVLKLASSSGVRKVKYRVYEFPEGFPLPSGWTQERPNVYSVVLANGANAPTITLPPSGEDLKGKYLFDAVANDQQVNGARAAGLRSKAQVEIPFASGVPDFAFGEDDEFDPYRKWVSPVKKLIRAFNAAVISGGGVTVHSLLTGLSADDHLQYLPRSGVRAMLAALSLGGFKITDLATPTLATDAATKAYVDATAGFSPSGTPAPGDVVKWDGIQPVWGGPVAYSVTAFAAATPVLEVGATATNPAFTAAHNRAPTSLLLTNTDNGESKSVVGSPNAFASSQSYTKTTNNTAVAFTVTGSDGVSPANRSASISWRPQVYWGTGAAGLSTEAHIEALSSSELLASRVKTFSVTASGSLKIYFACPASYGTPTFTVGGFSGGFTLVSSTIPVTNAFGVTQNYQLWESNVPGLGATTVAVT